jgi:YVTN family beta-propeller protein
MIFVSGDGKRVVTSNVSSATMTILDLVAAGRGRGPAAPAGGGNRGTPPGAPQGGRGRGQTNWDATVIGVGRGVEGFDVSPDGKEIWAANAQDGTISVIDASARTVSQTIQANVNGANRLKFTPDGTKVLVSSLGGPELAVFDVAKHQALKRIPIGRRSRHRSPAGRLRAYVAYA